MSLKNLENLVRPHQSCFKAPNCMHESFSQKKFYFLTSTKNSKSEFTCQKNARPFIAQPNSQILKAIVTNVQQTPNSITSILFQTTTDLTTIDKIGFLGISKKPFSLRRSLMPIFKTWDRILSCRNIFNNFQYGAT